MVVMMSCYRMYFWEQYPHMEYIQKGVLFTGPRPSKLALASVRAPFDPLALSPPPPPPPLLPTLLEESFFALVIVCACAPLVVV